MLQGTLAAVLVTSGLVTTGPAPVVAATPVPDCPPTIVCKYVPAAHAQNGSDPVDYGNYDTANRPVDITIDSVVVHNTEGDLKSVLELFQNSRAYVSTHYVIDADGTVYQMVPLSAVPWHAGNWWYNMHSVGIEHVGHLANGHVEYTPAMYRASAALVKYLANRFKFPLDRQHVVGHDNVPAVRGSGIRAMHTDPGPFWNWQKYMALLGAPVLPTSLSGGPLVTVAPVWPLHKVPVVGCSPSGACVPPQGGPFSANFVYLRTEPRLNAPLVTDPVLGQGSTQVENTAARAYHGQKFALAGHKFADNGVWYKVWYAGQLAWFHSPWKAPTAFPNKGKYITPKVGKTTIPTYGRPLPEKSEYPADFEPPAGSVPYPEALPYIIAAGQRYSVADDTIDTDHYFAWTFDESLLYDHTNFKGETEYILVQFNGRFVFVKASDVQVVTA